MNLLGSTRPPRLTLPNPVGMPKPAKMPKLSTPKLAAVHVQKVPSGGFKVQHVMTSGPKPRPFVFSDPRMMAKHLKRIEASQWRMPDRNEGAAVNKQLDLNSGMGASSY